jgi:hypothetical protein
MRLRDRRRNSTWARPQSHQANAPHNRTKPRSPTHHAKKRPKCEFTISGCSSDIRWPRGVPLKGRLRLWAPGGQHVPELAYRCCLRSPEREQRRLDPAAGLVIRAVLLKIDPRGCAMVFANGTDGVLAAITAEVLRHGLGCDSARRLALHGLNDHADGSQGPG